MKLFIDTTNLQEIRFKLLKGKNLVAEEKISLDFQQKGDILRHLEKFLQKQNISLGTGNKKITSPLTRISVRTGEGSYSGIRIGTSIAQALSLALGLSFTTVKK